MQSSNLVCLHTRLLVENGETPEHMLARHAREDRKRSDTYLRAEMTCVAPAFMLARALTIAGVCKEMFVSRMAHIPIIIPELLLEHPHIWCQLLRLKAAKRLDGGDPQLPCVFNVVTFLI